MHGESEKDDDRNKKDLDSFGKLKELAEAATNPLVLAEIERQFESDQQSSKKIREENIDKNVKNTHGYRAKKFKPTQTLVHDPQTPVLPRILRQKIDNLGGNEVNFVLQKSFIAAARGRSVRLPIRSAQTVFLRDDEKTRLDVGQQRLEVKLIDQSCREFKMVLKRWDCRTNGKVYALTTKWNDVVRSNGLEQGDEIKLWSFRVGNELYFALQTTKKAARLG